MSEFINTIDVLGDDAVIDSIIMRTITEFKDNRVEKVGFNAFRKCTALKTVDLPNATIIDSSAFNGCTALTSVNCPKAEPKAGAFSDCAALTSARFPMANRIGDSVFANCISLSDIYMPKVTAIDGSGFNKTALDFADFPVLTYLGGFALANSPLTTLILRSQTVATLSNVSALQNTSIATGTGYIFVPEALVDSYKKATNWSTYANQIRAIEDYPEITGG